MGHSFNFSEDSCLVSIIATLFIVILLTIIAFLILRIEQQDETISNLNMKISQMEQSKMVDKGAVRSMYLKELFERLDLLHENTKP